MKKLIISLLVFALLAQTVYAFSTNLGISYSPSQTVLVSISGSILEPLTKDNVEFLRGHVAVPFDFEIAKLGEDYYIWFITPPIEGNYTLSLKNIATTVSGTAKSIDYSKDFSVSGNMSDYTLKPGFIYTTGDFYVSIFLNEDADRTISVDFPEAREVILRPGQNEVSFSTAAIYGSRLIYISIGKYPFLAYIVSNKTAIKFVNETIIQQLLEEQNLTNVEKVEDIETGRRVQNLCYEINGKPCASGETCTNGDQQLIAGEICCVGLQASCLKPAEGASYAWAGYLIGGVLLIAAAFIGLRYYKAREENNPLQKKVEEIERKH